MDKGKSRRSGVELLRILCILGIVAMHSFGNFLADAEGFEIFYGVLMCSLFNCGVSIFALISGYFGVKGGIRRVVTLELEILFWSILSMVLRSWIVGGFTVSALAESVTPVFSRKYWYMTEYMIILIFAPYINSFCERLEKGAFQKCLLALFTIGYVIPTVIQRDLSGYDGKCFLNLLFMYLLGRYIHRFVSLETLKTKRLIAVLGVTVASVIALNLAGSLAWNALGSAGAHNPFGKDNSVFTAVISVSLFCLFGKMNWHSGRINGLAKHVAAVYLFENAAGLLVRACVLDPSTYRGAGVTFYLILVSFPFLVYAICAAVSMLKTLIFGRIQDWLADGISNTLGRLFGWMLRKFGKLGGE